jgi:hypothetical protein
MQGVFQHSVRIGLSSLLILVAVGTSAASHNPAASAAALGNDEKSLSGSRTSPRAVETEKPARRSKPRAEPEEASSRCAQERWWRRRQFRWRLGLPSRRVCGGSTERFTISGGRISGELSSGSVSPNGSATFRRLRIWIELEQLRPFLGQQRLRHVQAIGRLQRNVDSVETIEPQIILPKLYSRNWKPLLMRDIAQRTINTTLLCITCIFAITTSAAFAQSGSAGGSIGNDEKSLSGSRSTPRAARE